MVMDVPSETRKGGGTDIVVIDVQVRQGKEVKVVQT